MDAQLPVDPRTLNAGEDAQVGGEPRGVWKAVERSSQDHNEIILSPGDSLELLRTHY